MNPPVHTTSLGLVGNWQLLVAFLLRLACRPSGLSGRTPVGIPPREPRSLGHQRSLARSSTITRSPAPLPVELRPNFLPSLPCAPALRHHLGQHSMALRCLGSRSWRKGLGLWIGNGLGSGMREFRARLCYLSCFLFVFGSVDFFLVPLPLFVLVLLVFACLCLSLLPPSSDWYRTSGLLYFGRGEGFCRRLYIRDVYVRSLSSPRSNSHSFVQEHLRLFLFLRYSLWSSSHVFAPDTSPSISRSRLF
jgi:hypothetical protein